MNEDQPSLDDRFQFGTNWRAFLSCLNDERIVGAEESLKERLRISDLNGKTFLDIGCGSGLFSLAARRLGAKVVSFDYDPNCVQCGEYLKDKFFKNDSNWRIFRGSALDSEQLAVLGTFDVVYSWGVLHHTGEMWRALDNASKRVSQCGKLFISIYNDQGALSTFWKAFKRRYCKLPYPLQAVLAVPWFLWQQFNVMVVKGLILGRPVSKEVRGMNRWHDTIDWLGGYPFEVAKPEQIFEFFKDRGFVLDGIKTVGGKHGCNEFVFERITIT